MRRNKYLVIRGKVRSEWIEKWDEEVYIGGTSGGQDIGVGGRKCLEIDSRYRKLIFIPQISFSFGSTGLFFFLFSFFVPFLQLFLSYFSFRLLFVSLFHFMSTMTLSLSLSLSLSIPRPLSLCFCFSLLFSIFYNNFSVSVSFYFSLFLWPFFYRSFSPLLSLFSSNFPFP